MRPGRVRACDVVAYYQLRLFKVFFEYVYVFFCHSKALFGIELFCEACMPFAPYAERADVNEGDIRIAVVPFGELADHSVEIF